MDIENANAVLRKICAEKGWDLRRVSDWNNILGEIDARYDQRRYKCPICKDAGIVAWIDSDDGLFYGRRCGYCRYWDDQREKSKGRS